MKQAILFILLLPLFSASAQNTITKEGGPTDVYYNRGDAMTPLNLKALEEREAYVPAVDLHLYRLELNSIRSNQRGWAPLILGSVLMAGGGVLFKLQPFEKPWQNTVLAGAATGGGAIAYSIGIHRLSHKREARRRATWLYYDTYVWQ